MSDVRSMCPLFYNGQFNQENRKIRAVLEREVSNGTQTYQLWRSAGKPDNLYSRAENDQYILYVEVGGVLVSLGMTDYDLIDRCGSEFAPNPWRGKDEERGLYVNELRKKGGQEAVLAFLDEERKENVRYGSDPAFQTEYLQAELVECVRQYKIAKENGGQTSPNFIGALVVGELPQCVELNEVYNAKRKAEIAVRKARREEEDRLYCEERNREARNAVAEVIRIIKECGSFQNRKITFYKTPHSGRVYTVVGYLMRLYEIDVPIRTLGWIDEMLISVDVHSELTINYQFWRGKRGRGSEKFYECMQTLVRAVNSQPSKESQILMDI